MNYYEKVHLIANNLYACSVTVKTLFNLIFYSNPSLPEADSTAQKLDKSLVSHMPMFMKRKIMFR